MQAEVYFGKDEVIINAPQGTVKFRSLYDVTINGIRVKSIELINDTLKCLPELQEFIINMDSSGVNIDLDKKEELIEIFVKDKIKAKKLLEEIIKNAPDDKPKIYRYDEYYIVIATKDYAFKICNTGNNNIYPEWVYGESYYVSVSNKKILNNVNDAFEFFKLIHNVNLRWRTRETIENAWLVNKDEAKKLLKKYINNQETRKNISKAFDNIMPHKIINLKNAYAIRCYQWCDNKIIFKKTVYEVRNYTFGRIIRKGYFNPQIYKSAKIVDKISCEECIREMSKIKSLIPLAVECKISQTP
jgi:hypothetical protein